MGLLIFIGSRPKVSAICLTRVVLPAPISP